MSHGFLSLIFVTYPKVDLSLFNKVTPAINQIEINPFNQQAKVIEALKAEGKNGIFENEILSEIGKKYNKSVAQVIVRWLVEQDIVVLAKTVNSERMLENLDVFDFSLTYENKAAIATLNIGKSHFSSHADPTMIKMLYEN